MNKIKFVIIFISLVNITLAQEVKWEGESVNFSHGKLKVSENNRYLVFEDGTPFFWLGDTAWELFHRLTKKEAEQYLENRREKGFTVIQAVILAELDGLDTPNKEGELPLYDNDPTRINESYFEHVDWVIKKAEEKGLFIGLLPTWGDKVDMKWGVGPVIFNENNARIYGEIIAERYKNFPNIIWIVGGDRNPSENTLPVWNAFGESIDKIDDNHLITYHPQRLNSSSNWFHESDWLDFNMIQTGHRNRDYSPYITTVKSDYNKKPDKPTLDGEPRYEDHPVEWLPEVLGWFDDIDVRRAAYWSLFTGSFGHTYGCHPIWQMHAPEFNAVGLARNYWYNVLDLPGAWDMIHVRKLMESRSFLDRKPFQEFILNEYVPEYEYIVATRGADYAMVFIPSGRKVILDLKLLGWKKAQASWYNIHNGEVSEIGVLNANEAKSFKPEGLNRRGNDWVLVLDNVNNIP